MKKAIILMTTLMMCVFMFLNLQEIKSEDQWTWEKAPEDATLLLNLSSLDMDESLTVHILTALADQYQANIELITNRTIKDQYIVYHALYLTHDYSADHTLISGRDLEIADMASNVFVASFDTQDPSQIGIYEDLFGDDPAYYYPLIAYVNQYNLSGQIFITFLDPSNQGSFMNDLSQVLGIEKEQLFSDMINYYVEPSNATFLHTLTLVFFIGFLFILGFYILKQSKKISVLKLNGYGQMDINVILLKPVLVTQLILLCLMMFFVYLWLPSIWFDMTKKMVMMICISTLVCLALIQLIQSHISVTLLIKNNSHRSFYTGISFTAKIFMALICSYILGICLTNLDYARALQKEMTAWEPYLNTAAVHSYRTDDTSWNKNLDLFRDPSAISDFYSEICDLSYLIYPSTFQYERRESNYLIASENYLQQYHFYDENGNRITFGPEIEQALLLVPLSMKDFDYHDYPMTRDYDDPLIWYYDDTQSEPIFSYDPYFAKDNHYEIKNPLISVKTPLNMQNDYSFLANNGILKFLDPDSLEEVMALYKEHLSVKPILETYEQAFENKISLVERIQRVYLPIFLMTALVYIFLLYQLTRIYITNDAKKLAVHYTLGYSTLRSFQNYFMMVMTTWVFSIMAYYLASFSQYGEWNRFRFIEYDLSSIALLGIWGFCLFELLILIAIIFWTKRQSYVIYLKGGN